MKGTIHCIHKLDNQWIFIYLEKVGKDIIPKRFPYIVNNVTVQDGQEIVGDVVNVGGIEYIKQRA